jgi:hypothetical protein
MVASVAVSSAARAVTRRKLSAPTAVTVAACRRGPSVS